MTEILSTHVARTVEDWPELLVVPPFICMISRKTGFGQYSEYMPFLYGVAQTLAYNDINMETLTHAFITGMQCHYICKTVGLD